MLGTILIVILVLAFMGALPHGRMAEVGDIIQAEESD
jgi:hypothetical protein